MSTKTRIKEASGDFFNQTGASANWVRPSSPARKPASTTRKVMAYSTPLSLNLDNFDHPQFEGSTYVLTSPRSLEACSRLAIKPLELLHRPLLDFEEDLLPQGVPVSTIYQLYDASETERLNKMQLCREERDLLIHEDGPETDLYTSPTIRGSASHPVVAPTLSKKSSVREVLVEGSTNRGERLYSSESADSGLEEEAAVLDAGSLHRRRTAWTTGIGHDRVTQTELNERAKQLCEEGQTLSKAVVDAADKHPNQPFKRSKTPHRKKHERQHPHLVSEHDHNDRDIHTRGGSTGSMSDVSSVTSNRTGCSQLWGRDPLADAKPIANPVLRKKLQGARDSSARVTTKDQKILERMLAKREEEKLQKDRREVAHSQWERDRERESMAKAKAELKRKQSFQEQRRNSETRRVTKQSQRKRADESHRRETEDAINHCDRRLSEASQRQLELKQKQLEEQRLRSMERKKSVEERLERQRREEEEYKQLMQAKQNKDVRRSQSMKEQREQEIAMRAKLRNYHAKKRHDEKWSRLKRQSSEDLNNLKATITVKHQTAEHKVKEAKEAREEQLRQSLIDLERRLDQSKDSQKKLGQEMSSWQKQLLQYRRQQEEQAIKTAQKKVEERKKHVAEERARKQQIQKENLKKLQQQEEEWKADMEATLAMKDARSKTLLQEKDEVIQESRHLAHASQRLREELRQHYSMNDLDKLNRHAEMQARLA